MSVDGWVNLGMLWAVLAFFIALFITASHHKKNPLPFRTQKHIDSQTGVVSKNHGFFVWLGAIWGMTFASVFVLAFVVNSIHFFADFFAQLNSLFTDAG